MHSTSLFLLYTEVNMFDKRYIDTYFRVFQYFVLIEVSVNAKITFVLRE